MDSISLTLIHIRNRQQFYKTSNGQIYRDLAKSSTIYLNVLLEAYNSWVCVFTLFTFTTIIM